jgi:branched-chain amino acid transport system ATP-binding protein
MPLLELEDVDVSYGSVRATHGISLTVEEGETLALVGSNGAGKSSTLKAIMGMAPVSRGRVRMNGADITGLKPSQVVRRGVGYAPEGRRVFPLLSVLDNLRTGAYTLPRARFRSRLEQMYTYFPRLQERAGQLCGSLSGGEQQMLAIARALMSCPRLFLVDEPSLGLAPVIVQRIGQLIAEIQQSERLAVILAEQNAL